MNDKDTVVVPRWKLVPVEPDEHPAGLAMLVAGKTSLFSCSEDPELDDARRCWSAILAAAPSTSVREGPHQVRIAAWNAAKKAGATDEVGYAVADAIAAEFAALKPSTDKGDVVEDHVRDGPKMIEPVWEAQSGRVVWHTSEEGGGPDVGITIGLGGGKILWVGERSDKEGGGLGMLVYDGTGITANAELGDYMEVYSLLEDHVAPALAALKPSPDKGDVR